MIENFSSNKVPVLSIELQHVDNTTNQQEIDGHMVFISGIEIGEEVITAIRISDPNLTQPFWLMGDLLEKFLKGEVIYSASPDSRTYAGPAPVATLLWFEKTSVSDQTITTLTTL